MKHYDFDPLQNMVHLRENLGLKNINAIQGTTCVNVFINISYTVGQEGLLLYAVSVTWAI